MTFSSTERAQLASASEQGTSAARIVSEPSAACTALCATFRYFCISVALIDTSALLSKPYTSESTGRSSASGRSVPSSALTLFWYSRRFRRWNAGTTLPDAHTGDGSVPLPLAPPAVLPLPALPPLLGALGLLPVTPASHAASTRPPASAITSVDEAVDVMGSAFSVSARSAGRADTAQHLKWRSILATFNDFKADAIRASVQFSD